MEWKSFILRDRGFDFSPALGIISYTCIPSDMKEEMRFFLRVGFFIKALGRGGGREPAYKAFES